MFEKLGGVALVEVSVDMSVRGLCLKPYPNRPKGCPNFGCNRHPDCPPHAAPIGEVIDLRKNVWAAYERYDLEAHEARFRANNPGKDWTQKQARNLLHWQKGVANRAKQRAQRFIDSRCAFDGMLRIVEVPEGHGVNVFETMASARIILERPIVKWVHKVVLIGEPILDKPTGDKGNKCQ